MPYRVDGFRHFIVEQPQYQIQEVTSQIIEHDSFTTLICKKVKNISKLITDKKLSSCFQNEEIFVKLVELDESNETRGA